MRVIWVILLAATVAAALVAAAIEANGRWPLLVQVLAIAAGIAQLGLVVVAIAEVTR